jgi:HEAT repeat protein
VLGSLGQRAAAAAPALVEKLRDDHLRTAAAVALGSLGAGAVPAVLEALRDPDWSTRHGAAQALVRLAENTEEEGATGLDWKPFAVFGALKEMLGDELGLARMVAAEALGKLGRVGGVPVSQIVALLREPDARVRWGAAQALVLCGGKAGPEAAPLLLQTLRDEKPFVRAPSARALGVVHGDPAAIVPALIEAVGDEAYSEIPGAAADGLAELIRGGDGTTILPILLEKLRTESGEDTRTFIATAVSMLVSSHTSLVPALVKALADGKLTGPVVDILGRVGPAARAAVPELRKIASGKDDAFQAAVARAIALIERTGE